MERNRKITELGPLSLMCSGEACDGCADCVEACNKAMTFAQGRAAIQLVAGGGGHAPVFCRNCHDAPCVAACMPGCRHKDEATGRVITDYERCVGCWMCVMVCPFGAIQRLPAGPGRHHGIALKCDGCLDQSEAPCMAACRRKALGEVRPGELARQRRLEAALNIGGHGGHKTKSGGGPERE